MLPFRVKYMMKQGTLQGGASRQLADQSAWDRSVSSLWLCHQRSKTLQDITESEETPQISNQTYLSQQPGPWWHQATWKRRANGFQKGALRILFIVNKQKASQHIVCILQGLTNVFLPHEALWDILKPSLFTSMLMLRHTSSCLYLLAHWCVSCFITATLISVERRESIGRNMDIYVLNLYRALIEILWNSKCQHYSAIGGHQNTVWLKNNIVFR